MQEMTALSVLSLFDTTKSQRRSFAEQVISAIENGEVSALLVHCQIKATQSLIDQFLEKGEIKERYMPLVLAESAKFEKRFEFHGATFEQAEAGVKYDYTNCGDPEMDALLEEQELLNEKIKARQTFLKGINKHLDVVDADSGEVRSIYPPAKTSTSTVKVTLK